MTWAPCQRIVRADVPPSFRMRGIDTQTLLCWPPVSQGDAGDFSVEFGALLASGDSLSSLEVLTNGGIVSAKGIFGTCVTIWVQWLSPGQQQATVSVQTAWGEVLTVSVTILVNDIPALPEPALPTIAPEAGGLWNDGGVLSYASAATS
ncbi:hypothetical protein [Gluconobacter aidae]|uniref:Uncharacterized protein n=1 Tax=Gluconobacter aidae TaxID=2662454 RepID=A0A7X1SS75_9PROT|nr:hypothetical protein [Gluconobacter aidae]MQR99369.1 hypothetical protein [Gluconobacter aidae]